MTQKEKIHNMASCMLSILDTLKLHDKGSLLLDNETLSEIMFRKMKAYNIDLNKELGFTHLKPVIKSKITRFEVIDKTGRVYVNNNCNIELSYQDDNRTLKVFIKDGK
jgi:hypothetical protein